MTDPYHPEPIEGGRIPPPPPPPRVPRGDGRTLLPELGIYQLQPWRRLAARLVDWVIVGIPSWIMSTQIIETECHFNGTVGCSVPGWRYPLLGLVVLIITGGYFIGLGAFLGTTPGKLIFGLRVIKKDGTVPDVAVAFRRGMVDAGITLFLFLPFAAGQWFFVIALALASVGGAIQVVERTRQIDFYDELAGTYVVRN